MFVTHGPVDPESRLFAGRHAELSRMEDWLATTRCVGAVLGARQTGKTSLLLKLRHAMSGKYAFAFVDLQSVAGADFEECLAYVAAEITDQLAERLDSIDLGVPKHPKDFQEFLIRCARAARGVRIIVLLDEIGALSPEASLRLSSAIRAVFTSRHVKTELRRYVFIVAGAIDMIDIATARNSPLRNVAETIYLGDLSEPETEVLVSEMFSDISPAIHRPSYEQLRGWTSGHPYWTQRLAQELEHEVSNLSESAVDRLVEQLLRTEDRNLPHVFRALQADPTLLEFVRALLAGTPINFSRADPVIARLELLGLLKNNGGRCAIRNRIYEKALELDPVHRKPVARDLRRFMEILLAAQDAETVFPLVTRWLQETFQNRSVAVLTRKPADGRFEYEFGVGVEETTAAETRLGPGSHLSTLVAPSERSSLNLPHAETEVLRRLQTEVVVPVRSKGVSLALILIGRKLSGEEYDADDREFLAAAGEQTAAALDRIRLQFLERDAQRAWEIQRGLLPAELPQMPGFQFAASCQPARVVGGDYYDAFRVGERLVAFCIGDVVGKGMPAALLMSNLQALVRTLSSEATGSGSLCEGVNRLIAGNVHPGEFITFFYAVLDSSTRRLVYTNAGHNPPLLFRSSGEVLPLEDGGPLLGVFPDYAYGQSEITLDPGDRLLLFTDGVTEARDSGGEEFGESRLIAAVQSAADAATLHETTIEAVRRFCGGDFHDDVTVLAISA